MFIVAGKDVLMTMEDRGAWVESPANGSVRFSIFLNTIDFSLKG